MTIEIWWSDKIAKGNLKPFTEFCQRMANRLIQGETRYGSGSKEQNYMTRMIMEMKHYKRTGNQESLFNIANYCLLEQIFPENKRSYLDTCEESVTRSKLGGQKD